MYTKHMGVLTSLPTTATPAAHTHAWSDIADAPDFALADHNHDDVYSKLDHTHTMGEIINEYTYTPPSGASSNDSTDNGSDQTDTTDNGSDQTDNKDINDYINAYTPFYPGNNG